MDASRAETRPPWSNLQKDLLADIANRLDSRTEVLYFRGVCTTWRDAVPLPKTSSIPQPLELPYPISPNPALNPKFVGHFALIENTVYCIQPLNETSDNGRKKTPKSWLVNIEYSEEVGKVRYLDPFSPFWNRNLSGKVLNLLDYKVFEVSKVYNLQFVGTGENPENEISIHEMDSITIRKVVLSNDPFLVMAIHTDAELGIWKMTDNTWINIDDGHEHSHYVDIAYHKGKFYAGDSMGHDISVDFSLKITEVLRPFSRGFSGGLAKYLVKSSGDLLLVHKYVDPEFHYATDSESDSDFGGVDLDYPFYFQVYKLNEEENRWRFVESLGDRAIILGYYGNFSVSAREFPGCKSNCIYFTDDSFVECDDKHPGYDAGLYDLKNHCAKPLSAAVGYSELFWPPPTWLK
ncbi:F-box protein SKIP23-like [Quillaja saponaria]|uniref:F-box protein SKIP23-like n=1 Tax=Quillaja saponaria TaxID=32244 RepID=A0AAD7KR32_QUISA|nr:F-box protein SKIP23-like [Quillaja saponaria]